MSFRLRLTLWNIGILAIATLLVGGIMAFANQKLAMHAIDQELISRTERGMGGQRVGPPGQGGGGGGAGFGQGGGQRRQPDPDNPEGMLRQNQGGGSGTNQPQTEPGPPNGNFEPGFGAAQRYPALPEGLDDESREILNLRRPRMINLERKVMNPPGVTEPWDEGLLNASFAGRVEFKTIRTATRSLRIISLPIKRQGQVIGVIQAASELDTLDSIRKSQLLALAILIPCTLLLAGIGGMFLTRRAMKPIEEVTEAAKEITENNLNRNIPTQGNDELAQLAQEFNGMVARLNTSFAEKDRLLQIQKQFTADASHELRTPLTRIKIITSSSQDDPEIDADTKERLATIGHSADQMTGLVEQMLLLARSEGQVNPQNLAPHSVNSIVKNAVRISGLEKDIRLKLSLSGDLSLNCDSSSLERAVINLLTNAARHTPEDGSIEVAVVKGANSVQIVVMDSGEGIPAEHLPNLTRRFYRVDSSRTQASGGTGLGLSIVESIVTAHGGKLTISSVVGKGTTATIELPVHS
ncbi:MAG: HAMP domain-containing histidine kinase [Fimbriimonadaceae bacterium]|nr:HAMP domain-containing histidine kinase [Fimbriimonadaceae bacterium]